MDRIKKIIHEINTSANDSKSTLESILNKIAEGVHDYFINDDRDFGNVMSYIVLYPHTKAQFELPAVHPDFYRDDLNDALNQTRNGNGKAPQSIAYRAYIHGETQNIGNVRDEKYAAIFAPYQQLDLPDVRSHLSVPIIAYRRRPPSSLEHSDETIGVISIEVENEQAFTKDDEQIVELLAEYSAGIVDNKRIALSLEALQSATQELSSTLSLDTLEAICENVAEMAVSILKSLHQEVAFCHVALLEQVGTERILNFKAMRNGDEIEDGDKIITQKIGGNMLNLDNPPEELVGKVGIVGRCILDSETKNVGDVRKDSDYIVLDERVRSQLAIPIKLENAILGAINVEYFEAHAFDMNEQHILESLAAATAIAIQNIRLRVALNEISEASSSYPSIINILKLVMDKTTELVTFQHSESVTTTIGIVGKEGGIKYDYPLIPENEEPLLLKHGKGLSHQVISMGDAVYQPNVAYAPQYVPINKNSVSEYLAPIIVGASNTDPGTIMAIISIQSPVQDAFGEYTFQIVRLFAGQAASAIRNHRLFRTLRKLHEISSNTQLDTTLISNDNINKDWIPDRTTEEMRVVDSTTAAVLQTQEMMIVDSEAEKRRYLLMNATSEAQLASIIFHITKDIISFNDEVQFEAMLVTFLPEEPEIANLYDFTNIDRGPRPDFHAKSISDLNIVGRVIKSLEIITSDQTHKPSLESLQGYESFIFVPMVLDKDCYGVLSIFSQRNDAFNADDEWMLQNIADRAAEAYSNFRRVRRLNEGVLALNEIDNKIIRLLTADDGDELDALDETDNRGRFNQIDNDEQRHLKSMGTIWAFVVKTAIKLTGADGGSMFRYLPENRTLELVYNRGMYGVGNIGHSYELDEEGIVETFAAREKRIVSLTDLKPEERIDRKEQSSVAIPLIADERERYDDVLDDQMRLVGVLTVRSGNQNVFNNEKIDLLKALAGQAVVALRYSSLLSRMGDLFNTNIKLSHLDHDEAAQLILDKALEFMTTGEGLRGIVHTLNIATSTLDLVCTAGFEDNNPLHQKFVGRTKLLGLNQNNGISEAALYRRRNYVEDVQAGKRYEMFYGDMPDIRSVLSMAIYGSREPINGDNTNPQVVRGVITVISSSPDAFKLYDRRLLIYFANQVELAWLYVNQKKRMDELATINQEWGQVSSHTESTRERWRVLNIWDKVTRLIGATSGLIVERHIGTGELHWADDNNVLVNDFDMISLLSEDDSEEPQEQSWDEGVHGWVVKSQKAINVPDVNEIPHLDPDNDAQNSQDELHFLPMKLKAPEQEKGATVLMKRIRSQLAVPMLDIKGMIRGVISVESPVPYAFDSNDMRFLQVLANQAWSVIDSAQSQRNDTEVGILPTFFSMLHDHKNTLTGLRVLLGLNSEVIGDNKKISERVQRYVKLLEETETAFRQLQQQEKMESTVRLVSDILEDIRKGFNYPKSEDEDKKSIQVVTSGCEGIYICFDSRLEHVFRNLLHNATKYGAAPIIIGAEPNPITQMVALWVEDNGLGISKKILETIYEPKFTRKAESGWGLGLWFTKLFVQSMGGMIEKPEPLDEITDHGTRFRFWLPIEQEETGKNK